jgi:MFS family permease
MLAPILGPTVGGYITDLMSWHWLFFINIVPGIAITIGVLALVDFDEPQRRNSKKPNWPNRRQKMSCNWRRNRSSKPQKP